jgi:hypothetical protein
MTASEIEKSSPRLMARTAGTIYLLTGFAYVFADNFVRGKLIVSDDAASTVHNILAHETLYRAGFAADLLSSIWFIPVTLLFYELFKPVNRKIALLAAFFSLSGCVVAAFGSIFHLIPLVLLSGSPYLSAFSTAQLQTLMLFFLKLRAEASTIYMVFFGCYNISIGYLVFRSKFLPRVIGVFMMIAGITYQSFLWPPLLTRIFPYVVGPAGALGELSLVFWLILFGVNAQRWKEQARTTFSSC